MKRFCFFINRVGGINKGHAVTYIHIERWEEGSEGYGSGTTSIYAGRQSMMGRMNGALMKTVTSLLLAIIVLSLQMSCAQPIQSHWLIGHWEGKIEGFSSKEGPAPDRKTQQVLQGQQPPIAEELAVAQHAPRGDSCQQDARAKAGDKQRHSQRTS